MTKLIIGFIVGLVFTGSLFQFDINLPSYNSTEVKKLKNETKKLKNETKKLKEVKQTVKKKRAKLTSKSVKKTSKKVAAAAIPLLGTVVVTGLSVDDYCSDLEDNIILSNLLNDTNESFSYDECYANAKKDVKSFWHVMATMLSEWYKDVDLEMPKMPDWFNDMFDIS